MSIYEFPLKTPHNLVPFSAWKKIIIPPSE